MSKHGGGPDRTLKSIRVTIQRHSEKAYLVRSDKGIEMWIPKSEISNIIPVKWEFGDSVTITVPTWLAKRKKL